VGRRVAAAIEARARGGRRVRAARGDDEGDHREGRTDARRFEPPENVCAGEMPSWRRCVTLCPPAVPTKKISVGCTNGQAHVRANNQSPLEKALRKVAVPRVPRALSAASPGRIGADGRRPR